jgi:Cd2+/Zn2+-exporting ATPase
MGWSEAVYRALAFLILACPCALVIATPVAVVAALARASSAGVLVKGGAHLEAGAAIEVVAFDKTGTVTQGRPVVTDVVGWSGSEDEVVRLAAALEVRSEHPLARAIVAEADRRGLAVGSVADFEAERGSGARGRVEGRSVVVGAPRRFADHPDLAARRRELDRFMSQGATVVVVADDRSLLGMLTLADIPRPTARQDVAALAEVGVRHTVLLTGDHEAAAHAVATALGIGEVRAGLLPGDKVDAVVDLERRVGPVAMVGDGVNDAPALARATLGIAMGTAGSPTAIETADVALLADDLGKVPGFLGLSRWSLAVVRQNIAFALGTKGVAAAFALAGLLPLWVAVLTDVGATLVVVANGLRLLGHRPVGRLRGAPMLEPTNGARG